MLVRVSERMNTTVLEVEGHKGVFIVSSPVDDSYIHNVYYCDVSVSNHHYLISVFVGVGDREIFDHDSAVRHVSDLIMYEGYLEVAIKAFNFLRSVE